LRLDPKVSIHLARIVVKPAIKLKTAKSFKMVLDHVVHQKTSARARPTPMARKMSFAIDGVVFTGCGWIIF